MTTRSQDVAQFMIMTLQPSWEKERLGKRLSSTPYFPLTVFLVKYTKRSRELQERSWL